MSTAKGAHIGVANQKRLVSFIAWVDKNPSNYYEAKPFFEDINIWYVKIKNLSEEYTDGEYILKIDFSKEYPFKPPDYYMLTPSGRFEINRKICFSNSGYHSESWSPLWGIEQIIMGIISFFYERNSVGISHISNGSNEQRTIFAKSSKEYNQKYLKDILAMFDKIKSDSEPIVSEPIKTEPIKTEPIKTEPIKTEPVVSEPVKSEPIIALAKTEPTKKIVKKSEPIIALAETEPTKKVAKESELIVATKTKTEPIKKVVKKSEPVQTEPIVATKTESEIVKLVETEIDTKPKVKRGRPKKTEN